MWIGAWWFTNSIWLAAAALQGRGGTLRASGLGFARPFDLVNAAERIYLVLSPNPFRYGARSDIALH